MLQILPNKRYTIWSVKLIPKFLKNQKFLSIYFKGIILRKIVFKNQSEYFLIYCQEYKILCTREKNKKHGTECTKILHVFPYSM